MSYETILFEVDSGVARLTLNRPDKLNSFNMQMHGEVRQALASIPESGARVLILTGAGRGFCAGQDLGDRAVAPGSQGVDLGESIENRYNPLVLSLRNLGMPVIAAVNGVAAGAGANIALACDIVIAARSANFVQAFSKLGLIPDSGGTWFLPRLVGDARAMGLTLLGNKLPAEQAAAWGLIWQCVDDAELAATVDAMARQFAVAPTRGLAATKNALRRSWQNTFKEQLDLERDVQRELGRSSDYVEGVAAFTEKRTPRFTGR
jgi:2-(1,2-epoxy-1,2-dihydrophenyl)acetyl-CoA isomerase